MSAAKTTVTKRDMIERISETTGLRRADVKSVVQEFLDEIVRELGDGRRLEFRDFGVFEVRTRAARLAQNPKTLEPVPVPAKKTVKFKAGRKMKDVLDGPEGGSGGGGSPAGSSPRSPGGGSLREVKPESNSRVNTNHKG